MHYEFRNSDNFIREWSQYLEWRFHELLMECAIYHIFEIKFAHQRSEMLKMLNSNKPLSVLKAFLALEELDYTVLDAVEMNERWIRHGTTLGILPDMVGEGSSWDQCRSTEPRWNSPRTCRDRVVLVGAILRGAQRTDHSMFYIPISTSVKFNSLLPAGRILGITTCKYTVSYEFNCKI